MDFDDCPPPLPPPVFEEEKVDETPEEPPMTALDGNGGDAWIMRGLDAMRLQNQSAPSFPPPPEVHPVTPPTTQLESDVPEDLTPPPLIDNPEEQPPGIDSKVPTTNLFDAEETPAPALSPPIAFDPVKEEITPAHEVPPVLDGTLRERREQAVLLKEEEEEAIVMANRRASIQPGGNSPATGTLQHTETSNDAAFDDADGEAALPRAALVHSPSATADADAPVDEVEAESVATNIDIQSAQVRGDDELSTNVVSDSNNDGVYSEEFGGNTRAATYQTAPTDNSLDDVRIDEGNDVDPNNESRSTSTESTEGTPVPHQLEIDAVPDTASEKPTEENSLTAASKEYLDSNQAREAFSDNAEPTQSTATEEHYDPQSEVRSEQYEDDYTNHAQPINEQPTRLATRSVEKDESDVEDDRKYVRLPVGDRVVRNSEFEAFASRAVELIQNLQDQKDAEVHSLQEDMQQLAAATRSDLNETVTEAITSLEDKTRKDYMSHIGALQEHIDGKLDEVIQRGDSFVTDNVEALKQHIAFEIQSAENREETRLLEHIEKLNEKIAGMNERFQYMQQAMEVMQTALTRAMDLEQLPEPRPIPEGAKIRLQVRLEVTNVKPVPIILVPISSKANVSDLKHEAIRRARRQGSIPDSVVYSKTAINFENLTLFDDDDFADIGLDRGDLTVSLIFTGAEAAVQRHYESNISSNTSASVASSTAPTEHKTVPSTVLFSAGGIPMHLSSGFSMPPPPPMGAASASASVTSAGVGSPLNNQPPPPPMMANFPTAPARPNLTASKDIITGYFLREELAKDINEQETLERRLMGELERMERDPLKNQERMCRIRLAKDSINRIRSALLDKATYCYQEAHRAAARATLANIQTVMDNPTSSVDDYIRASNDAQRVVDGLATNTGEQGRIDALEEAAARNQAKKDRMKDDLEELGYQLRNKLRISHELMPMAERLMDQIDRCSILAASMSLEELDEVHSRVVSFISSVKSKQ